jgi:hypothetical protein
VDYFHRYNVALFRRIRQAHGFVGFVGLGHGRGAPPLGKLLLAQRGVGIWRDWGSRGEEKGIMFSSYSPAVPCSLSYSF